MKRKIDNSILIQYFLVPSIQDDLKKLYKTVWEISQKTIIDMAADRGAFIDQSQSLNIHLADATFGKLTSMHFYGWKKGLKTGMYYLRSRPAADAIKFTVDQLALQEESAAQKDRSSVASEDAAQNSREESALREVACSIENKDACLMCSG